MGRQVCGAALALTLRSPSASLDIGSQRRHRNQGGELRPVHMVHGRDVRPPRGSVPGYGALGLHEPGSGRDRKEKEYAIHDTHMALIEAKRTGDGAVLHDGGPLRPRLPEDDVRRYRL